VTRLDPAHFTIVAGHEAVAASRASQDRHVVDGGESLVRWQEQEGSRWIGAEIVKSIYGYGLRYASGLQGFAVIFGHHDRGYDGTYETAVRYAQWWVDLDPEHRYVFVRNSALPAPLIEAGAPGGGL
jgi:hypothetical protein